MTTRKRKPRPKPDALKRAMATAVAKYEAAQMASAPPPRGSTVRPKWIIKDAGKSVYHEAEEIDADAGQTEWHGRLELEFNAFLRAVNDVGRGSARRAGKLGGDYSKGARAKHAAVLDAFLRSDQVTLLTGASISKSAIKEFLAGLDDDAAADEYSKPSFVEAFIKFCRRYPEFVQDRIASAPKGKPTR